MESKATALRNKIREDFEKLDEKEIERYDAEKSGGGPRQVIDFMSQV